MFFCLFPWISSPTTAGWQPFHVHKQSLSPVWRHNKKRNATHTHTRNALWTFWHETIVLQKCLLSLFSSLPFFICVFLFLTDKWRTIKSGIATIHAESPKRILFLWQRSLSSNRQVHKTEPPRFFVSTFDTEKHKKTPRNLNGECFPLHVVVFFRPNTVALNTRNTHWQETRKRQKKRKGRSSHSQENSRTNNIHIHTQVMNNNYGRKLSSSSLKTFLFIGNGVIRRNTCNESEHHTHKKHNNSKGGLCQSVFFFWSHSCLFFFSFFVSVICGAPPNLHTECPELRFHAR